MRKTRCELPIKRAREAGVGGSGLPPSPRLPTSPPSPGGGVVGLNAVPNHGSGPSGWDVLRTWDGLPPDWQSPWTAGCGRGAYREEGRTGRGPDRAGPERSKFRSESARGVDPFSARQFSALPI